MEGGKKEEGPQIVAKGQHLASFHFPNLNTFNESLILGSSAYIAH